MIDVNQAEQLIAQATRSLGSPPSLPLSLEDSRFAICHQTVIRDRPHPPFDRVAMDGIALSRKRYVQGQRRFVVSEVARAGAVQTSLLHESQCVEVMTGCVLPRGTDAVIRYEDLIRDNDGDSGGDSYAFLVKEGLNLTPFRNVHRSGIDAPQGATVISRLQPLLPPEWSLLAETGTCEVLVARPPAVAIVSTGDELVHYRQTPAAHQIRSSNEHGIRACLAHLGCDRVSTHHLKDDPQVMTETIHSILELHPYVVLSGGVSMGAYDHLPQVLRELGVREIFHKVAQRPGKPLWFGQASQGQLVFGLPGNPMSSLITFVRYVIPSIRNYLGYPSQKYYARLESDVGFDKSLTLFQPVVLNHLEDGTLRATPKSHHGSGDLVSLTGTHGFLQLPPHGQPFEAKAQKAYEYFPWINL